MKVVGLTGGIGSGKTSVAKILEQKGYSVYYSDMRAKEIVADRNSFIGQQIVDLLGERAYDIEGKYNRKWVAKRIFGDDVLRESLNAIIHPAVKRDFEQWLSVQNGRFVFKETALLFELGLEKSCFCSILVTAEKHFRIKRVMDRDGKSYREVEQIISKQMSEREKIQKADLVIKNEGNLEELEEKVMKIIAELNNIKE